MALQFGSLPRFQSTTDDIVPFRLLENTVRVRAIEATTTT
jgi:hypothetical protein